MQRSREGSAGPPDDLEQRADADAAPARLVEHTGRLWARLNGRTLVAAGRKWKIDVFDITQHAGCRWIQLTLRGRPSHVLTLKVEPRQGATQVLEALAAWLRRPLTIGEVVHVGAPSAGGTRRPS